MKFILVYYNFHCSVWSYYNFHWPVCRPC